MISVVVDSVSVVITVGSSVVVGCVEVCNVVGIVVGIVETGMVEGSVDVISEIVVLFALVVSVVSLGSVVT